LVRRLDAADSADWIIKGCERQPPSTKRAGGAAPDPRLILKKHAKSSALRIPGPFDPASFNLIALQVEWSRRWEVQLELMAGGEHVARSAAQVLPDGEGSSILLFEFAGTRRIEQELDEIVLRFSKCRGPLKILGLGLMIQPDHQFLPSPWGSPGRVTIGQEWRRAVGVSSLQRVSTELTPILGQALRFSYGVPGDLLLEGVQSQLRVRMTGADGTSTERALELDSGDTTARWRQALIPLGSFAGRALHVEWSVETTSGEALGSCAVGDVSLLHPGIKRPVVVFVTSDTHRGDHLGAAGEGVDIDTPFLDALAARGVLFEDCFSTSNVTNPSHVAMMTGVHPRDTGITNNATRLSEAATTLADVFREAGYLTFASISTKHLSDDVSGLGQGFERGSAPIAEISRAGASTIEVLDRWLDDSLGMPVFIWLHLFDAHTPYGNETPNVERYYKDRQRAFDESLPELGARAARTVRVLSMPGLRDIAYPRALYRAKLTELDRELDEFLGQAFFEGAVIAITGDHGESLGNHALYFTHAELYRDSLHVPLILSWPGGPRGLRCSEPVSNLDLGRTLLDLSGHQGVDFPGRNLARVLKQEGHSAPRFTLSAHGREVAMTEDGWHFQLRLQPNVLEDGSVTRAEHQAELYFLPDDSACADDRLDAEFERARSMRGRLLAWLARPVTDDWLGRDSGDAETLANLEALGYTGGQGSTSSSFAVDPDCECRWCGRFR